MSDQKSDSNMIVRCFLQAILAFLSLLVNRVPIRLKMINPMVTINLGTKKNTSIRPISQLEVSAGIQNDGMKVAISRIAKTLVKTKYRV